MCANLNITYKPVNFVISRKGVAKKFGLEKHLKNTFIFVQNALFFRQSSCSNVFFQLTRVFIRHRRLGNSPANVWLPLTVILFRRGASFKIFFCNITPFSCYWNS